MSSGDPMVDTEYLILRKTPYGDTGLILAGIGPQVGQVHLLVRGARKLGRKSFPVPDLFRRMRVVYREGRGELHTPRMLEMLEDFSMLARSPDAYRAAGSLARFALDNVLPGIEHGAFFLALTVAFRRLADVAAGRLAVPTDAMAIGVYITYLEESGWLSAYADDADTARRCRIMLEMGAGGPIPEGVSPELWVRLRHWVARRLRQAECRLPEDAH